ncbi:MAG: DNA polymerase IV [Acidimicrobiia bacterium]|nr:DNA polymerase IV [Acidimicrobiia bacterium]
MNRPRTFAERIAHVDMDAFFVEVERLRRPDLKGRAVVVGGAGPRSVVASASYEARRYGVHSAMPMIQARRLCPHLVVVVPDHAEYQAVSAEVFSVFAEFTPLVEAVSVDEAFLDIAGLRRHAATPAEVGERIRRTIRLRLGLPSSVGLGTTKLVAKMASRDAKPDGLLLVAAGGEIEYLHRKPVRALWGVGEATHARLEEIGVVTIGDLAALPRDALIRRLGGALGGHLADLAAGIDPRPVAPGEETRSISVEETYDTDLSDLGRMRRELLAQADRLAARLHHERLLAATVHLKVRYGDFTTVTRSHTFSAPVATARDLYRTTLALLERTDAAVRPVRLLGIGASGLVAADAPRQLVLTEGAWVEVERAIANVRDRFGHSAVDRASLTGEGGDDGRLPGSP